MKLDKRPTYFGCIHKILSLAQFHTYEDKLIGQEFLIVWSWTTTFSIPTPPLPPENKWEAMKLLQLYSRPGKWWRPPA